MKQILYGIKYIIEHQIFKKNTPLIAGLTLTDKCNLRCLHCRVSNIGKENLSFEESIAILNSFYEEGGRSVYFQGGEPFMWHDGANSLEDLIKQAKKIGYLTTVIYTNGTNPIETSSDTVFISIDGLKKTHDFLRGKSFDRIMKNILESVHPSIFINYTINNYNKNEIEKFCGFIDKINQIHGIFFYFHTPYYGHDNLYIESGGRIEILHKLMDYKKKYKILNSKAGLNSALNNDWKRPLSICRVYEKRKIYECCSFPGNPEVCRDCGYLSYAEIDQTLKLKPSAILNAMKYF